jgi:hypothetical protein
MYMSKVRITGMDNQTTEMVIKASEAAKEVAIATQDTVKAAERAGSFLAKVLGDAPENLFGIVADKVTLWRWERRLRLMDRVDEIINTREINGKTRPVPPKFALPAIEHASLESEDTLQNLWANLLANAMTPSLDTPKTCYIEILKQLDSIDIRVLNLIYRNYLGSVAKQTLKDSDSPTILGFNGEDIMRLNGLNRSQFEAVIDNLIMVQCVTFHRLSGADITISGVPIKTDKGYDSISLTTLGRNFVSACSE